MNLVSTIGWSEVVVEYAAKILLPEKITVFYGPSEDDRILTAIENLKRKVNVPLTAVQVDPMDFKQCTDIMKKYIDDSCVANITGGTKVMSFTLALLCASRNLPIIYVLTENGQMRILRVPVRLVKKATNFITSPDSTATILLEILIKNFNGEAHLKELRKAIGNVKYSTLSDAKNRLIRANLIKESKKGREKLIIANAGAYIIYDLYKKE